MVGASVAQQTLVVLLNRLHQRSLQVLHRIEVLLASLMGIVLHHSQAILRVARGLPIQILALVHLAQGVRQGL